MDIPKMISLIEKRDLDTGLKKNVKLEKPIGNQLDLPKIGLSEILLRLNVVDMVILGILLQIVSSTSINL